MVNLKLCRFEDAPWGFRLVGGADFEFPLTVVKVTEGSIAEQAGLQVNDIILRINDTPTIDLSHNDAHQIIMHCGNNFFLGVSREDSEEEKCQKDMEPNITNTSEAQKECRSHSKSPSKDVIDLMTEECVIENESSSNIVEKNKVSDDEIADMISGEAEVLKEHNVIGVNCYRIFPKAEICQSSEVFRQLNEEAVKTKVEAEKDKRKWTTFLQKPDRPIPKSKKEIEDEAKRVPYRVSITKQKKPKVAPDHIPTPPLPESLVEPDPAPVTEIITELQEIENQNEPPTDNEVPNLEPVNDNADEAELEYSQQQQTPKAEETIEAVRSDNQDCDIAEQIKSVENEIPSKSEEELAIERQLANVQQQLLALSNLPSTIQATLDAVTKQLSELLPTFRLQPALESDNNTDFQIKEETDSLADSERQEETVYEENTNGMNNVEENDHGIITSCEDLVTTNKQMETEDIGHTVPDPTVEQLEKETLEQNQLKAQEELSYKKQKEEHVRMEEEHQNLLVADKTPKRVKRAFGPLTPQERPLVLPGGRKWRRPKDAYNEEFIAEILSSQAELIVGSTLGSTFESPLLGYDQRVNFLKYQKPEKRIDLDRSEVYKVVHHLEKVPKRGIEARPEKVLAESDVRSRATPIF